MKLSEFKKILAEHTELVFTLPSGENVPSHFHITEVGQIDKKFIDCGGTVRFDSKINFQLWYNDSDIHHRLKAEKLLGIVRLSEDKLGIQDHEIEVEYQTETIGKFALDFDGNNFLLKSTLTDCLAPDKCGIPVVEETKANTCTPGSGCC